MGVLPACIAVHNMHAWCLLRPEEGERVLDPLRTGVTDNCGLSYVCKESNPGPLEESALLITRPTLHFENVLCFNFMLLSFTFYL